MSKNGKRTRAPGPKSGPPEAVAQIGPGPVPTQFFTQTITANDGSRWCLLTALTPLGSQTYWLPAGLPGELSAMLAAREQDLQGASSGLIVPTVDVREVIRTMEQEGGQA